MYFLYITLFISFLNCQNYLNSKLPLIIIDTYNEEIVDEPRIIAHMGIINNNDNNNYYDESNEYNGMISIELRGNSSLNNPKKSYRFETILENGENNNVSLLGMPEENDWILYAPYQDKTLIRNVLTYAIYNAMDRYTSRTKYCELFIDGEYMGVYVLMEKIKRDSNRIDINKLKNTEIQGDDLTGGYILEFNHDADETNSFNSIYDEMSYQYYYPDYDEIVLEQKEYIQQFVNDFETVMTSEDYNNLDYGYSNIIDVSSFIDFVIIQEMSKNIDGYIYSTFLYKDKNSLNNKFIAGPIWDFNHAFGNCDYGIVQPWDVTGWRIQFTDDFFGSFWWIKMWDDEYFHTLLANRWNSLRLNILSDDNIQILINDLVDSIGTEAISDNFSKWQILGIYTWPNYIVFDTYSEELEYLQQWIIERFQWIDEQINYVDDFIYGDINDDLEVNIFDLVYLVYLIFDESPYFAAIDLNSDEQINVVDITQLINIILNN